MLALVGFEGREQRRRKDMGYRLSEARRAGATICLCVIAGSAVLGCRGNAAQASPTPAPTHYAGAQRLATSLTYPGQLSGPLKGTLKIGSDTFPLSGTVSLDGKNSQVDLSEDGSSQVTAHEIVIGGHRYSSPDGSLWIDRGAEPKGTSLAEMLAAADTAVDYGTSTVDGVKAHKILTGADVVDVAPALGIDTWTFDNETTALRVWADASGKLLGFGASMSWLETLGGAQETVSADFDVMFTYTSPVQIAAPAKPWQWVQDKPQGIAFAVPQGWIKDNALKSPLTVYSLRSAGETLQYGQLGTMTISLADFTSQMRTGFGIGSGDPQSTSLALEPALRVSAGDVKNGIYLVMVSSIHETVGFTMLVGGPRASNQALDNLTDQIVSTVEYTR
jgi:hypothetical protein